MKYRKLGTSDFDISILSAELLGLDFVADGLKREDFDEQIEAVRYAFGEGVNALNLGLPFYLDEPERYTGKIKALLAEDGVKGKVRLFANMSMTGDLTIADLDNRLGLLHEWFGVECFDYCLVEDIDRFAWKRVEQLGVVDWVKGQVKAGRVREFGFDFRDDCFFLKNIFDAYEWGVAQFRYSFMDSTLHPGFSGIEYVVNAKAGLVTTEPFKTRRLLANIPEAAQELWGGGRVQRDAEEWALLWVWNHPEISSVFTSFENKDEAKRFIEYADRQEPIVMLDEIAINKVIDVYKKKRVFACTECRCCMPCPIDMDSPGIAALYNDYLMYGNADVPRFLYGIRGFDKIECKACGVCSKHCPRKYKLMDVVQEAQALFGNS
ncbi:MAG: hypothetical protein FWH32_00710 [Clostridiales bacterium]|nr:hypothetical protein [Clostridiales bacterium]